MSGALRTTTTLSCGVSGTRTVTTCSDSAMRPSGVVTRKESSAAPLGSGGGTIAHWPPTSATERA